MTIVPIGSFGLMLAVALSLSMWPTAGRAYTPEQQQACTGDAFRLCSSDIPDVERVTACMIRNKSQLSPPCRAQFRPGPEPAEYTDRRVGRPTVIRPTASRKSPHKPHKHRATSAKRAKRAAN